MNLAMSLVCLMNASCIPDVQDLGKGDTQDSWHESCMPHGFSQSFLQDQILHESCHESCMSHECILHPRRARFREG